MKEPTTPWLSFSRLLAGIQVFLFCPSIRVDPPGTEPWIPDSFFCHSCESRNPGLFSLRTEEKEKPLDPLLNWIPDQVEDKRRGQASRMTEGENEDDREGKTGMTEGNIENGQRMTGGFIYVSHHRFGSFSLSKISENSGQFDTLVDKKMLTLFLKSSAF